MHIPTQDELIGRIEQWCERHDISESRLGRDALNNPAFVSGLRGGKSPTLDTLNKLKEHMDRADADSALQAKLNAPIEPAAGEEADVELPFSQAPVDKTGASSPTSSSTAALRRTRGASASCRSSGSSSDAEVSA